LLWTAASRSATREHADQRINMRAGNVLNSALTERRQPAPSIQICAPRGFCRYVQIGVQNSG
jgi:hypothetical protein